MHFNRELSILASAILLHDMLKALNPGGCSLKFSYKILVAAQMHCTIIILAFYCYTFSSIIYSWWSPMKLQKACAFSFWVGLFINYKDWILYNFFLLHKKVMFLERIVVSAFFSLTIDMIVENFLHGHWCEIHIYDYRQIEWWFTVKYIQSKRYIIYECVHTHEMKWKQPSVLACQYLNTHLSSSGTSSAANPWEGSLISLITSEYCWTNKEKEK